MIIPIQCKTCGKNIVNLYPDYCEKVAELDAKKAIEQKDQLEEDRLLEEVQKSHLLEEKDSVKTVLDSYDLRECCVLMIMTHVNLVEHI
jgi:DNA-directed RNA polymerase subunit N (RpoN/RPB10)